VSAVTAQAPGWRDVLRSENAKLRSVYRLVALPAVGVVAILLIGISQSNQQERYDAHLPPGVPAALFQGPDPLSIVFGGIGPAAVLFAFFGAYCACVEYAGGMIRSSLTAVPRRGAFFGAKLTAALLAAAPAVLASVLTVFWIGDALLARHLGVSVGAFEGRALIRVLGAVAYLLAATVLGFGIGMLTRSTPASIVILVIVFLFFTALLDAAVSRSVQEYLSPMLLGERLYDLDAASDAPALPLAYPLLLAWPAIALSAAYLRFTRSDA
jgi:ABC-2 type transport system permease protein